MTFPMEETTRLAWAFFALYCFIFILAILLLIYAQFGRKDVGRSRIVLITKIFYVFVIIFSCVRMLDLLLLLCIDDDVTNASTNFILSRFALCCLLTAFSLVVYRGAKNVFALNKTTVTVCFWLLILLNVACWICQLICCIIFLSIFDYSASASSMSGGGMSMMHM